MAGGLRRGHTQEQEGDKCGDGHDSEAQLGYCCQWKEEEAEGEKARRVARIGERNGCAQQALAAAKDVIVHRELAVELQLLHLGDGGPVDELREHLQAAHHLHPAQTPVGTALRLDVAAAHQEPP